MQLYIANGAHVGYAQQICDTLEASAAQRGTGIARRSTEYIESKIQKGHAIIALDGKKFAGFCYIETWDHGKYVANSGLIVHPDYRQQGLARLLKAKVFNLSRELFPEARIFGITTGLAVMKINYELGYEPVTFSELTKDPSFWNGCQTCKNYDILTRTNRSMCLCTGMLYDPNKEKTRRKHSFDSKVWTRLKNIKQSLFLKKSNEKITQK